VNKAWVQTPCAACGGHGVCWRGDNVWDCTDCGGAGFFWLSENGRYADYPGGPLRGSGGGAEFLVRCAERIRELQTSEKRLWGKLDIATETLRKLCDQIVEGGISQTVGIDVEELILKLTEETRLELQKEYGIKLEKVDYW
jgi:hypothetical protein